MLPHLPVQSDMPWKLCCKPWWRLRILWRCLSERFDIPGECEPTVDCVTAARLFWMICSVKSSDPVRVMVEPVRSLESCFEWVQAAERKCDVAVTETLEFDRLCANIRRGSFPVAARFLLFVWHDEWLTESPSGIRCSQSTSRLNSWSNNYNINNYSAIQSYSSKSIQWYSIRLETKSCRIS